jgi:hypothetical protein
MSVIAVMVNCAVIGLSDFADRLLPDYTAAQRILLIVLLEVCWIVYLHPNNGIKTENVFTTLSCVSTELPLNTHDKF